MAKKTKDSNLSLDERLEQALIPNWDEPYRLPPNWCWIKLSALSSIISKGTTPTGGKSAYVTEGVHFLRIENINDDGTISHDNIACVTEEMHTGFLKRSILEERDVLVSIAGTLGKTGLVRDIDLPLNTNQAIAFVRLNSETINESYIKSAIDSPVMQKFLLGKTKVTSIPNLTLEIIGDCPIPLAPFNEQQRIVACIESFFAKLDEAKEKAQEVVDGFETRKAAILHKAFSGELTARWRFEKQIDDNYSEISIGELFTHTTGKALKKGNTTGLLRQYITTSNVYWGEFDFSEIREMYFTEKELDKCTARKGDLLICNGGDVGRAAIWEYDYDICLQNHISKLRPKQNNVDVKFIYYYFMNSKMRGAINGKGIVISSLSAKDLLAMKVMLPTFVEQQKIVEILDSLINNELKAKETAEAVIEQIDTMKKAILARAFRGELGTNDPNEESAVELLKKIL